MLGAHAVDPFSVPPGTPVPCGYLPDPEVPTRMCGHPALYAVRLTGWPAEHPDAPMCAEHGAAARSWPNVAQIRSLR